MFTRVIEKYIGHVSSKFKFLNLSLLDFETSVKKLVICPWSCQTTISWKDCIVIVCLFFLCERACFFSLFVFFFHSQNAAGTKTRWVRCSWRKNEKFDLKESKTDSCSKGPQKNEQFCPHSRQTMVCWRRWFFQFRFEISLKNKNTRFENLRINEKPTIEKKNASDVSTRFFFFARGLALTTTSSVFNYYYYYWIIQFDATFNFMCLSYKHILYVHKKNTNRTKIDTHSCGSWKIVFGAINTSPSWDRDVGHWYHGDRKWNRIRESSRLTRGTPICRKISPIGGNLSNHNLHWSNAAWPTTRRAKSTIFSDYPEFAPERLYRAKKKSQTIVRRTDRKSPRSVTHPHELHSWGTHSKRLERPTLQSKKHNCDNWRKGKIQCMFSYPVRNTFNRETLTSNKIELILGKNISTRLSLYSFLRDKSRPLVRSQWHGTNPMRAHVRDVEALLHDALRRTLRGVLVAGGRYRSCCARKRAPGKIP